MVEAAVPRLIYDPGIDEADLFEDLLTAMRRSQGKDDQSQEES